MNLFYNYIYMKLKIKYNFLKGGSYNTSSNKNSFPGIFNIVQNRKDLIAVYIYSKDPKTGNYYFTLARKIPLGARINIINKNTGAAGTARKYMGKWGNFGGSIGKKNITLLQAAISEINEEGNLNVDLTKNVSINNKNYDPNKYLILKKFYLINESKNLSKKNSNIQKLSIFLFEMNSNHFFENFPKYPSIRGGADIVMQSKGEIDFITSMSMKQIINKQKNSIKKNNNNFILPYCVKTFNDYIIPYIESISNDFKKKNYIIKYSDVDKELDDPYNKKYKEVYDPEIHSENILKFNKKSTYIEI